MPPLLPRGHARRAGDLVSGFLCELCNRVAPRATRCAVCRACASCCDGDHQGDLEVLRELAPEPSFLERLQDIDAMEDEGLPYFWNRGS